MARKHDKRRVAAVESGLVWVVSARVAGHRYAVHFAEGVSAGLADHVRRLLAAIKPREGFAWVKDEIRRVVSGGWKFEGEG